MNDNRFWRNWPADVRVPYLLLLGLTLLTILWSIYEYLYGPDRAIPWQTDTLFDSVPLVIDQFQRMVHPFGIQASGYLLSERYAVGLPELSPWVAHLYLLLLAAAAVYYLAAITMLRRLLFAVGMLLFMLLLASFNADALGLIQSTRNYYLIGMLVLYGLLTYYFHAFAAHNSFSTRLVAVALLTVFLALGIYLLSSYDGLTTSLHLIGHSSPAVLVAGVLFIVLVAFDNVMALLWLNGQGNTPQQRPGFSRYILASLLYLLSLLFIYLADTGFFQVDVSFITPFFLLVVSFCTGLWAVRHREKVYGRWVPFRPAGAVIYLSLAIIAFLGASYAFGTANDPVVEAFNDAVLFTHLAFGTLFFIYTMANFALLMFQRLPVYRVVYEPRRIPFFTVYTAGGILLLALLMYTGLNSYHQAEAGYYNYLGDVYQSEGNDLLAERYYTEGHIYENNNVRSNLNLAALANKKHFNNTQIVFMKRTLLKRPEEKLYLRLANLYADKGSLFDALFLLREGLKHYPQSHRLHNNIALLFSRTDVLDSTAIYIDRAYALEEEPLIASNSLALLLRNGLYDAAQKYASEKAPKNYVPFQSNRALLYLVTGQADKVEKPDLEAKPLTEGTFTLLYHRTLAHLHQADSGMVSRLQRLRLLDENISWNENLGLLRVLVQRYHGNRTEARRNLEQLALNSSANDGYYLDLMGLWLLEEEAYRAAAELFDKAKTAGYEPAFMHHAYALSLGGMASEAANEARRVLTSGDPQLIRQSVTLQKLLETPPNAFLTTTSDTLLAQLLELYHNELPLEVRSGAIGRIKQPELRALAQARLANDLIAANRPDEAEGLLQQMQEQGLTAALPAGTTDRLQAALLHARRQHKELLSRLGQLQFGFGYEGLKTYYRAISLWETGKPKEAAPLFAQVPGLLPYHTPALLETVRFYNQQLQEPMQAYDILLSAMAYDPYSVPLLKAYVMQALELNLPSYAEYADQRLRELLRPEDYATFKAQYDQKVSQKAASGESW